MRTFSSTAALATSAVILSGCIDVGGDPDTKNTRAGAVIGATTGAAATIIGGGDTGTVLAGAVLGGVVGAVAGNVIDKQERELREELGGSGAVVTRDGNQLTVTLPEAITFDTDSTFVRSNLRDDLARLAANLQRYPDSTVDVVGHTDSVGDASYNQNLSARRATAVSNILTANGVPSSRIRSYGRGELEPIASNETASGRAANRRVAIVINPKG